MTTRISHNYIYLPSPLSLLFPILIHICGIQENSADEPIYREEMKMQT